MHGIKVLLKINLRNNLFLLICQGIKANKLGTNDLYIFLESGETNIFLSEMFTASKLSFKIGYIFWNTQYIILVLA